MSKLNLLLIRETWGHMSSVSGFDPLFDAISASPKVNAKSIFVSREEVERFYQPIQQKQKVIHKIVRKIGSNQPSNLTKALPKVPFVKEDVYITPFIQNIHEEVFDIAYLEDIKNKYDLILFSVAENQFGKGLFSAPKEFKRKCVLFFHQPPSWLKLNWTNFKVLNDFAAVVTLSTPHCDFFKSIVSCPVIKIKHGVNLNFFRPDNISKDASLIKMLFVGSWLRDFEILYKVTEHLVLKGISFQLNCIIPRKDRENVYLIKLSRMDQVNFFSDLSEDDLRQMYQTHHLLFLPLIDSTANNAMNEAMASGLPIVTGNFGGTADYLGKNYPYLANYKSDKHYFESILLLLDAMKANDNIGLSLREKAEQTLNWNVIAHELLSQLNTKGRGVN